MSLQSAFILHSRPYRETSAIVELFSHEYGRVTTVARGAKSSPRMRALLQPFAPLLVSWQGKSEMMTLVGIEMNGAPYRLAGDCLLSAFYLNELLVRLLHKHDAYPRLYTIYSETLLELQQQKLQQKTLRLFEKKLLVELGYGLQLQYDIPDGQPIMPEFEYRFFPDQGFKRRDEHDVAAAFLFSGKSLVDIALDQLDDLQSLRDAKRLMRLALRPLLGAQPLHSRKLFLEVESHEK